MAYDEGEPMTAVGLLSTTSFLLSCGVHPDDLGEAWGFARAIQYEADHPSQMGRLVKALHRFAEEKHQERTRLAAGRFGRHTAPISLPDPSEQAPTLAP